MLVIMGDQGFESMKKALSQRVTWVANLQVAECNGHHHLHMDDPIPVAKHINDFLLRKIA
jgi:hypothetical protein